MVARISSQRQRTPAHTVRTCGASLPRACAGDTVEIWIPRRAPNLNDLIRAHAQHPHVYDRIKKGWAETVAVCARSPRRTLAGRVAVRFELVEPNERRDPDNIASGAAKLILDGLVKAGVLEGDGWAHIAGLSFSWRVGGEPGVRVILTPVDADRASKARGGLDG